MLFTDTEKTGGAGLKGKNQEFYVGPVKSEWLRNNSSGCWRGHQTCSSRDRLQTQAELAPSAHRRPSVRKVQKQWQCPLNKSMKCYVDIHDDNVETRSSCYLPADGRFMGNFYFSSFYIFWKPFFYWTYVIFTTNSLSHLHFRENWWYKSIFTDTYW